MHTPDACWQTNHLRLVFQNGWLDNSLAKTQKKFQLSGAVLFASRANINFFGIFFDWIQILLRRCRCRGVKKIFSKTVDFILWDNRAFVQPLVHNIIIRTFFSFLTHYVGWNIKLSVKIGKNLFWWNQLQKRVAVFCHPKKS